LFLTWPEDGRATIKSLAATERVMDGKIESVTLLGGNKAVTYRQDEKGLHLILPEQTNEYAVVVNLKIDGLLILD
jgi:alpha-L-fucosidase